MPNRGPFQVPPSTDTYRSRDAVYRAEFSTPLSKHNGQLTYPGYRRALQLYGNENEITRAAKCDHFRCWIRRNEHSYNTFRRRAEDEGLNPNEGFVELVGDQAVYHYYHLSDPQNTTHGSGTTYPDDPAELQPATPHQVQHLQSPAPSTTQSTRSAFQTIGLTSDDGTMAPPARNTRGRFIPELPEALTRMDGLRAPDDNNFEVTCVGSAELLSIFAELLERQYAAESNELSSI